MHLYWLWFSLLEELTLRQKLVLLERFTDPEEIYHTEELLPGVQVSKDLTKAQMVLNRCRRMHIRMLTFGDPAYPVSLRSIADPPLVLYYKGVLPDFDANPFIGVVGTRKATPYGLNQAKKLAEQITRCGGIVVSGGAVGVDTYALEGALAAEGRSVTVLGCGVDVAYPVTNRKLFMELQVNGCLISEYLPGEKPKPWHFPARNRIISGLSRGVLVVEAPEKSGALITANDALEQGRDVFVVPGNIDNQACAGSNHLLREGAIAVFSGWDVVKEYAAQYPCVTRNKAPAVEEPAAVPAEADKKVIDNTAAKPYSVLENNPGLSEAEQALLACLDPMPKPVDEVIAASGMNAATVLSMLTMLSLRGLVINHPGKLVSLNKQ